MTGRLFVTCRKGYRLMNTEKERNQEKEEDCLVARTPFHLEDGWDLVSDNANSSCSHAEIDTLIQKRTINLIDLEIMRVLAAYHYVNHHNLALALSMRLHPGYQKTSYLDNIRKLKRAGILLSYYPARLSDMAAGVSFSPASPLRLYCLSQPAFTYMEAITPDAHPMLPFSARRKMELAAANQFLIMFQKHYREQLIGSEYEKGVKIGNTPFLTDAVIRYRATFSGKQEKELVTLFLFSIRRQQGWEKSALTRLHLFSIWLSRHGAECLTPFPVLQMEDLSMALTLFARMQGMDSLAGLPVYFCMDSLLMVYPPLQTLYQCEVCEDGKVRAVRLEVSI